MSKNVRGRAVCQICGNAWTAVVHPEADVTQLECPNCQGQSSTFTFNPGQMPVMSQERVGQVIGQMFEREEREGKRLYENHDGVAYVLVNRNTGKCLVHDITPNGVEHRDGDILRRVEDRKLFVRRLRLVSGNSDIVEKLEAIDYHVNAC